MDVIFFGEIVICDDIVIAIDKTGANPTGPTCRVSLKSGYRTDPTQDSITNIFSQDTERKLNSSGTQPTTIKLINAKSDPQQNI